MSQVIKIIAFSAIIILVVAFARILLAGVRYEQKSYPPEVVNYSPVKFSAKASKPIYYAKEKTLFYSETGELFGSSDRKVFSGKFDKTYVFVSPDSRHVLINAEGTLYLISSTGEKTKIVDNVRYFEPDRKKIGMIFWRNDPIEWSPSATKVLLMKDVYHRAVGSQLFSDKASLYMYDLQTGALTEVLSSCPASDFYWSIDEKSIFYRVPTTGGHIKLEKYELATGNKELVGISSSNSKKPNAEIFVNFNRSFNHMGDRFIGYYLDINQQKMLRFNNQDKVGAMFVSENGSEKKLLEYRMGFIALKGFYSDIFTNLFISYFLPGGRYFVSEAYYKISKDKDFSGKLIIDLETGQYMEVLDDVDIYFDITSADVPQTYILEDDITLIDPAVSNSFN